MAAHQTLTVPLFPLSNVVLFPHSEVPLHVFEPRYRQMMEAALDGPRLIGMVTVLPDHREEMDGDPPLFPVGCAGFIRDFRRLADGRYDLVLRAIHRFRILREFPPSDARLYRVAEVLALDESEAVGDQDRTRAARRRVVELLAELARRTAASGSLEVAVEGLRELDDGSFVGTLCQYLGLEAEEKQGLLEAKGVADRLECLENVLCFERALLDLPGSGSAHRVH